MPNMGGLELIQKITEESIPVLTVIMTGFGTVETAIEAMKRGAYDYILKPFKVEEVVHIVQRGLDRQRLQHENIRLKDALAIYRISEAIATSLSVETVLDLVLDATLDAVDADVVSLLLEDPKREGRFIERMRKVAQRAEPDVQPPALNLDEVLPLFREDRPLLVHGSRSYRFLASPPDLNRRLVSFCSIPLKLKGRIIGMLNAYSYTRGAKFSEGQRKMLYVLGSRAAVSIENARLYENLVDANKDLTRANVSLEENFKQTIIGFAHALEESDRYTRGHSERVAMYARLIAHRPAPERAGHRHHRQGRPDARRGQDRHPQRQAQQAGQADARRAGDVPLAPGQGQAHPRADPLHARHRPRLLLPPRGVGRLGLPAGADGRQHPAHRPHRRHRRRLRRDDVRSRLPQGAAARGGVRRAGALHGRAVRPRDRAGLPGADRRVPQAGSGRRPLHPALSCHLLHAPPVSRFPASAIGRYCQRRCATRELCSRVLVVVVGLISGGPASRSLGAADETSAAREHAQKGKAFMDLGKYSEAAAEYEAAYAAKPDPALLLNLAQAYRLAGNADKALLLLSQVSAARAQVALPRRHRGEDRGAGKGGATGDGRRRRRRATNGLAAARTHRLGPDPGSAPGQPPTEPGATAAAAARIRDPARGHGAAAAGYPGYPPPAPPTQAPDAAPPSAAVDHGKNLSLAGLVTGGAGVLSLVVAAIFGAQAKDAAKNVEKTANAGGTFDPEMRIDAGAARRPRKSPSWSSASPRSPRAA